jgi:hypothetical protein
VEEQDETEFTREDYASGLAKHIIVHIGLARFEWSILDECISYTEECLLRDLVVCLRMCGDCWRASQLGCVVTKYRRVRNWKT